MALAAGTRLGPYEILEPLGAGGMGEVYRARDTRLDRTVAVKVLPSELSADSKVRQRLEREARAVSRLSHPHICTLHDVGRQGETDFLVMEYLEGESLAGRLEKGKLPLWRVAAEGGEEEQVTRPGAGVKALESMDGATLFFQRVAADGSPLVALTLADGGERTVVECVSGYQPAFAIAGDGLYYVDCTPDRPGLHRLDIPSGLDEPLGTLEGYWGHRLAVSPDGQTVLYASLVSEGSDIMLIENFR